MVAFCSEAWIAELDRAVRSAPGLRELGQLVVEQVVTGVPGRGEVRYRLVIDERGARVDAGTGDHAGLRFTLQYDTARAIATGSDVAQSALARGDLQIGGDLGLLATRREALLALDDATRELRAVTTFEEP